MILYFASGQRQQETQMNEWLDRTSASLKAALDAAKEGDIPQHNIYMLAPLIYSKMHHMNNDALLQEMMEANDEQVQSDWAVNKESKFQYKFHYVSSYLYCFVVAGKLDELKYDQIMEYVNSKMALFTETYEIENDA